ncbi:hypothetical protein ACQEVF_25210 [Nonomuraea polychroma]|uniref:hypothetical protein n=1 Tax=Nonomuraea polychroma TaxID=46176 RepID=UPI003D8C97BD
MSLSRITVLSYDGCVSATIGSAHVVDEQRILAAVESASQTAREQAADAIRVVVVDGRLDVTQTRLLPADLQRVQAMVGEANRRAHMEPTAGQ